MIRPIVLYPDPRLKQHSHPVEKFDEALKELASDMTDTMRDANGLGLAAVQVGEMIRFMVVESRYEQDDKGESLSLLNPEILAVEGTQMGEEGCLSIPEVREELERPYRVTLKAQDLDGRFGEHTFEGLLARCIFHEIDHMDGQLFVEKLPAVKRLFLKSRLKDLQKQYATAHQG